MVDLNAVDSSKKRVEYDSKIKTSVRNMRIREDTAHYLLHLDDDSAYYGASLPPIRLTRRPADAQHARRPGRVRAEAVGLRGGELRPRVERGGELPEDAAVRVGGEPEGQQRARGGAAHRDGWGSERGLSRSVAAAAGGGAEARAGGDAEEEAGAAVRNHAAGGEKRSGSGGRRELRGVRPERKGGEGVAAGREKGGSTRQAIPKSKYEEDLYPGNHSSVWGSWYNREEEKWGYACCHQCVKNAYCLADQA